jgi:hypothetical protein
MSYVEILITYYSIYLIESDRYVGVQTSAQIQTQPQETMGKLVCASTYRTGHGI